MIQGSHRRDVVMQTSINDIVVVSNRKLIDGSSPEWQNPSPSNGERICGDTDGGKTSDVCVAESVSLFS